jgi:methionyl-tRNA synthetase
MINQYCDGKIPGPHSETPGQKEMMELAENTPDEVYNHVRNFRITDAVAGAMKLVRATNRFLENAAPWQLAKEGKRNVVGGVLYAAAEMIRIASILLYPLMPKKMLEIRDIFGLDDSTLTLDSARIWFDLPHGNQVTIKKSVFPRMDAKKVPTLIAPPRDEENDQTGLITIDQFAKMELRVAEVVDAARVKGADKLLHLNITIGAEKRQIVAGIATHYSPEEIAGMKIIVVANLEPAKIRGIESHGMLLAAQKDGALTLVTVDKDIPSGASVS